MPVPARREIRIRAQAQTQSRPSAEPDSGPRLCPVSWQASLGINKCKTSTPWAQNCYRHRGGYLVRPSVDFDIDIDSDSDTRRDVVRCLTRLATRLSKLESQLELGLGFTRWSRQPKTKLYQTEANKENERLETAPTVAAPANLFGTAKLSLAWLQVVTVWGRSSALGNLRVSREQKKKQLQNTCNFISFRLPAPNSRRI